MLTVVSTDLGKVLAGIQVPESEHPVFDQFLQKLGYPFVEETHNPMFKRYFCE
jgi:threonine dehydratase